MIEIKVEKNKVTVSGSGKTVEVTAEMMLAMVAALRQIREIDKGAYKATCAWIKDGRLIEKAEEDD